MSHKLEEVTEVRNVPVMGFITATRILSRKFPNSMVECLLYNVKCKKAIIMYLQCDFNSEEDRKNSVKN